MYSPIAHHHLWIALLAGLTLTVAACSAPSDDGNGAGQASPHDRAARRGGSFTFAQDTPGTLDPAQMDDSYEAAIVNQLFDGLLSYDENLSTVPCLAASWTISKNGLVYTFQLKEGVRFHDGSELTARDVVYSLSRVFQLDPVRSVLAREYLSHIEGTRAFAEGDADGVEGLEALDRYTVRIRLEQPYASFLAVLASETARIVPRDYVERVGDLAFGREPVGTGPFSFASWQPLERVVLLHFADYHATTASLDSIVFEFPQVGHRDYSAERFLDGKLSGIEVPPNRLDDFREDPNVRIHTRQELSLRYMALNVEQQPFNDQSVRQAFLRAIDQQALCAPFEGVLLAPKGILPPGMPGFSPQEKIPAHNANEARRLLSVAGYPGGVGLPRIIHASANDSASERQLHAEIARQLAEVGFELETIYMDWLEFFERIERKEFHSYSVGWVADIPDPASFLDPLFHSAGSNNFSGYCNSEVDRLLDEGRRARSNERRWKLYRDAEKIVLSEASIVPLYSAVSTIAVRSNVRGFGITPLGMGSLNMEHVWLDPTPRNTEVAR